MRLGTVNRAWVASLGAGAVLATADVAQARNGWAMNKEQFAELMAPMFEDMSPEETAARFGHPNGFVVNAAADALAARGEAVMPLLLRLLGDQHPGLRRGAILTMHRWLGEGKNGDPVPDPELAERIVESLRPLAGDQNIEVSVTMGLLLQRIGADSEAVREILVELSKHPNPRTRGCAVAMGASVIEDAATAIRIGMHAVAAPQNVPSSWGRALRLIQSNLKDDAALAAIPTVAQFMRNMANSRPVRGMFSDSPQVISLEILDAVWSPDVQALPDVVPAVCRAYVRLPWSAYPGWFKARTLATGLLERLGPGAAPAIRATLAEEKAWLSSATDRQVRSVGVTRERARELIGYLERLAEALEQGAEPPETLKYILEKTYEDESSAMDLDATGLDL